MLRTLSVVFICVFILGCSSGKRTIVEAPPVPKPSPTDTPVTRLEVAVAPKLPEVQDAVKRVFKDAAVVHPSYSPNFVSGDFNGDASDDLAVVLKPDKVDEMNQEYPPWLLRDLKSDANARQPLRIAKDEVLLAVIHGYGTNDWRDPQATQTFVLKNAVGSDLRVHTGKEFVEANPGRKLPRPQGDLIGETLGGTAGYLYYATSRYSWYDPKTFNGQPEGGPFHKSRMRAHAMRAHAEKPLRAHVQKAPAIAMITVEELKTKINNNEPLAIIDVRGSEGFASSKSTIKGSWHFKVRRLKSRFKFAPLNKVPRDREVITYCACPKDEAAITAAQIFQEAGFTRVKVLQGGWTEWLKNNGPVQPK